MPQEYYNYNTPTQEGYNNYNSYSSSFRRINGLELIVIVIGILSLIGVFTWGLFSTNTENRDKQRLHDIDQVLIALDNFYSNSSTIPSQRFYPVSICSADLNEVDFESTLKNYLTGKKPEVDTHQYIAPENFPADNWGVYSKTFAERKIPFRCPNIL